MKRKSLVVVILFFISQLAPIAGVSASLHQLLPNERNTIDIFEKVSPLVVNLHHIQTVISPSQDVYQIPAQSGSGFLWDEQGHVVTNFHVVRGAHNISVTLKSGSTMKARVVGVSPRNDIAVLKIKPQDLKYLKSHGTIPIADSATLQVGQKTIAIGNPYGLDRTLTTGVVSALGRRINGVAGLPIHDMIQTDASINPGNSGGPLLNSAGELIGMNTSIYSSNGGASSVGIGFAVPSNTINRVVTQIIKHGRVIQPGLGIQRIDDSVARQLGIKGVIIGEVIPGSPASRAGLRGTWRDRYGKIHFGDVIVGLNSERVKNADDLYRALENLKVGDKVNVKYQRGDKTQTTILRLIDLSRF